MNLRKRAIEVKDALVAMGVDDPACTITADSNENLPWQLTMHGNRTGYLINPGSVVPNLKTFYGEDFQQVWDNYLLWKDKAPTYAEQKLKAYVNKLEEAKGIGEDLELGGELEALTLVAKLEELIAETKNRLLPKPDDDN